MKSWAQIHYGYILSVITDKNYIDYNMCFQIIYSLCIISHVVITSLHVCLSLL